MRDSESPAPKLEAGGRGVIGAALSRAVVFQKQPASQPIKSGQ